MIQATLRLLQVLKEEVSEEVCLERPLDVWLGISFGITRPFCLLLHYLRPLQTCSLSGCRYLSSLLLPAIDTTFNVILFRLLTFAECWGRCSRKSTVFSLRRKNVLVKVDGKGLKSKILPSDVLFKSIKADDIGNLVSPTCCILCQLRLQFILLS